MPKITQIKNSVSNQDAKNRNISLKCVYTYLFFYKAIIENQVYVLYKISDITIPRRLKYPIKVNYFSTNTIINLSTIVCEYDIYNS